MVFVELFLLGHDLCLISDVRVILRTFFFLLKIPSTLLDDVLIWSHFDTGHHTSLEIIFDMLHLQKSSKLLTLLDIGYVRQVAQVPLQCLSLVVNRRLKCAFDAEILDKSFLRKLVGAVGEACLRILFD